MAAQCVTVPVFVLGHANDPSMASEYLYFLPYACLHMHMVQLHNNTHLTLILGVRMCMMPRTAPS